MGTHWIVESRIDPRWPINTRGNVGEVFPEVVTPLTYELAVVPAERGWRRAYRELGVVATGDFSTDDPVIIGLYGGYCYLNLSFLRILGVRAPGSSPNAIDVSFFGEGDPPPYAPHPGDRNVLASLRILKTVLGALGQKDLPAIVADSFAAADAFAARRPALDAPDAELLAYVHALPEPFEVVFHNHMVTTAISSIVAGVLADACAAAGRPGDVTALIGAAGDVRSAMYARELYAVAQVVRDTPSVAAEFDAGIDGLLDRLAGCADAAVFHDRFAAFLREHGHRGPNDWELSGRTWDNTPELALVAIDRMRQAEHEIRGEPDPVVAARLRDDAIAAVRPHLSILDRLNFDKAIRSIGWWSQAREATRDRAVRLTLPAKQVYRELVRRSGERGGTTNATHLALLRPFDELPQYLADPTALADVLAERVALHSRFAAVTPRFFITSADEVPSIEELEAEQATDAPDAAPTGAVLTGNAGCAGVARGRVRVVLDPDDAGDLEPGEVLVAPLTDPAWTPLFLPAAAVVVNVGALMSHAVIVSRELGIPCVVAVAEATKRLSTGMMVEVDGASGTVTVL